MSNYIIVLIITTMAIYLMAAIRIVFSKKFGYVGLMFVVYHVLFLLAPSVFHVRDNVFPFYNLSYDSEVQLKAAIACMLFGILFWLGFFINKRSPSSDLNSKYKFPSLSASNSKLTLLAVSFIVIQTIFIYKIGIQNLAITRGEFDRTLFGDSVSIAELLINGIRSLSFQCLLFLIIFRKSIKNAVIRFVLLGASMMTFLIINYPMALPRFILFSYIICIFVIYIPATKFSKFGILTVFGLGLTTIFPFISHITRRSDEKFSFSMSEYYRSSGDFDGFQSIINVFEYVKYQGLSLGEQLLGAIFAFIPRGMWSSKAYPTGASAAEIVGYDYTNISSPIVSELYVDFGWPGIIVGSFLIGWLARILDRKLLTNPLTKNQFIIFISVAIITSLLIITQRGPLMGVMNILYVNILIATLSSFFIIPSKSRMGR